MPVLYLIEQHSWVSREGDCLIVHVPLLGEEKGIQGKREKKITIPLLKVEEVMVLGDITVTTPALGSLLQNNVHITYLTQYGRYLGTLFPSQTKNGLLRVAQHDVHKDYQKRHSIARQFVAVKLRNMRTILMRYQRTLADGVISTKIEQLKHCITTVEQLSPSNHLHVSEDVEHESEIDVEDKELGRMNGLGPLLGCEGAGSAAYFGVFGRLVKCEWPHGFVKRLRRPPTDPINAMLSYGYVILTSQVASILAGVGLDPYIGYLHASRYGKPALALDLMEEFRPVIVDSIVLGLLNNQQLNEKSFHKELNVCRMTEVTKRLFLQKFEERMEETIKHPIFGYKVSYRRCIELQARLLGKYLVGEIDRYTPFLVR